MNSREVKRTSSGLIIAPSAELMGIAPILSVYENMQATSAKNNTTSVIPVKSSSQSAKYLYRRKNQSNFYPSSNKSELSISEKRNKYQLNTDPYSAIGRDEMDIHEEVRPKTIFQMGKIFEGQTKKRSSSFKAKSNLITYRAR